MRWIFFFALCSCATTKPETPIIQPATQLTSTPITTSKPAAALSAPSTTQAVTSGCAKIEAVLDAEVYRGSPPKSQSQREASKANPDMDRDDHFLKYVACEYKVRINGKLYSYKDYISDVTKIDEMEPEMCEAQRAEIEAYIIKSTDGCVDLKGGEYYGYIFTPLK